MKKIDDRKIEYILLKLSDYLDEGIKGYELSSKVTYILLDSELNCTYDEIIEILEWSNEFFKGEIREYINECLDYVTTMVEKFKEVLMAPNVADQFSNRYSWFNCTFDEDFKSRIKVFFGLSEYRLKMDNNLPTYKYKLTESDEFLQNMLDYSLYFNKNHISDSFSPRFS